MDVLLPVLYPIRYKILPKSVIYFIFLKEKFGNVKYITYICVMKQNIIYGLRDPKTDEYHYIGKSNCGMSRPKSHFTFSHNQSVNIWIEELRNEGLIPLIDILEECNEDELLIKEKFWIQHYERVGCKLFNSIKYLGCSLEKMKNEIEEQKRILEAELQGIRKERLEISTIGGFIKNRRKFLNLKQNDLAELSNLSIRTIQQIENNSGNPTLKNVLSCLKMIGYTLYPILNKMEN